MLENPNNVKKVAQGCLDIVNHGILAFDTVIHGIPLKKLQMNGFRRTQKGNET